MDAIQVLSVVRGELSHDAQQLLYAAASLQSKTVPRFARPSTTKALVKAATDGVKVLPETLLTENCRCGISICM
jgi:hypothetical protein